MKHRAVCYAAMILSLFSSVAMAAAPKVVKAVPDNGATDVDPGTTELRVTFDQPMDMGGFSFVGGGETFPGSGRAHWIDQTTCVLPIALKPAHSYWLSINSDRFQNFCNKQGEPATPYPISFVTAGATGATTAAPKVVKAVPDNGATDVDPGATELRVTFDQAMDMGGFSFVGGGESFPGSGARAHWVDQTTCVLPIALKPAHSYWLSINSDRFQNFRSKQGEPATPYPISFVTAEAAGTPPLTPELNEAAIAKLRQAIQDDYAYLDLHKVDWNQEFALAEPALKKAKTAQQFAAIAGKILAKADDMHIWLMAGKVLVPAKIRRVDPNCSIPVLMRLVPNCQPKNAMVWTGRYDDGIAYVMIRNFTGDASLLSPALDVLQGCSAVIVDVRTNSGGDELLARQFAGCFVTAPQTYAKDIIRRGGQDSPVYERVLDPNPSRPTFGGKVALLIGPENMSSCESFIMMMKTSPNCTTIGQKTYGSSGNPRPHDLGNGVTVMLPSWRDLRLDGTCFEGEGLTPDIQVDGGGGVDDPVLDRALAVLHGTAAPVSGNQ